MMGMHLVACPSPQSKGAINTFCMLKLVCNVVLKLQFYYLNTNLELNYEKRKQNNRTSVIT